MRGDVAAEAAIWRSVGATFGECLEAANGRRALAAFADLRERSIVGEASMAAALGVDRSRIDQWIDHGDLYAFVAGDERCFPRWQLVDGKPVRGLRAVLGALDPGLHPLVVDHWFTGPNVDLSIDGTPTAPISWLAMGGRVEPVVRLVADR